MPRQSAHAVSTRKQAGHPFGTRVLLHPTAYPPSPSPRATNLHHACTDVRNREQGGWQRRKAQRELSRPQVSFWQHFKCIHIALFVVSFFLSTSTASPVGAPTFKCDELSACRLERTCTSSYAATIPSSSSSRSAVVLTLAPSAHAGPWLHQHRWLERAWPSGLESLAGTGEHMEVAPPASFASAPLAPTPHVRPSHVPPRSVV
jgi:hypothetical protein